MERDSARETNKRKTQRGVAQLVARDVWDVDAAGSNPVTPTKIADLTAFRGQIGANFNNFVTGGCVP